MRNGLAATQDGSRGLNDDPANRSFRHAQEALAQRALLARDRGNPAAAPIVAQLTSVRQQLAALSLANPRPGATFNYEAATPALVQHAVRMQAICERHGVDLKAAAIQFPLRHPAVASVLTGCRSVGEVEENVHMFQAPIPSALWDELDA